MGFNQEPLLGFGRRLINVALARFIGVGSEGCGSLARLNAQTSPKFRSGPTGTVQLLLGDVSASEIGPT